MLNSTSSLLVNRTYRITPTTTTCESYPPSVVLSNEKVFSFYSGGIGGLIKLSDWHESTAVDCLLLPPTASLLDRIVSSKLQCDRELSKRTRISLIHRIHTAGTAYRSCFIPASGNKIIPSI